MGFGVENRVEACIFLSIGTSRLNERVIMPKYEVHLSQERVIIVSATDEESAREKAEKKVNKKSNKWCANIAYEMKG
jgi:hypothetical protein